MPFDEMNPVSQEYRAVLVTPGSSGMLANRTIDGLCLPCVEVSLTDRPAEVLQKRLLAAWGVSVYVTDYLPSGPDSYSSPCVVGEVLGSMPQCSLVTASAEQLIPGQMNKEELSELCLRLEGKSLTVADTGRLGWLDEAYRWVEDAIGAKLAGKDTVQQQNMGGGFVLLRLQALDGQYYWLKATSAPNRHEYQVTRLIAQFADGAVAKVVASRDDWNAWLMEDVSNEQTSSASEVGRSSSPENAARALAKVQAISQHRIQDLLDIGVFDQRAAMTNEVSQELFDYLFECMRVQQSQKTPPLDRAALERTRETYLRGCEELRDLQIPFTVLHGDLTGGNVASTVANCKFLDWCETYIGFPIASLHHLRMHFEKNGADDSHLRLMDLHYRDEWSLCTGKELPKESLRWAPLMAAASALYGRGDWLHNEDERARPARRSYSRTLARHMARAAQSVAERAALCV